MKFQETETVELKSIVMDDIKKDKKYDTELISAGVRTIYKYGVAFSGKKVEVTMG